MKDQLSQCQQELATAQVKLRKSVLHLLALEFTSYIPFTRVRKIRTDVFFSCSTRLHGTVQILLQLAVLFAGHKLSRFHGSRVNKRRNPASF